MTLPDELEIQFEEEFIKQLKKDEQMELTKAQTRFADRVYEAVYGETLEDRDRKVEEDTKAQVMAEKILIVQRLLKLGTLTVGQIAVVASLSVSVVNTIRQEMDKE